MRNSKLRACVIVISVLLVIAVVIFLSAQWNFEGNGNDNHSVSELSFDNLDLGANPGVGFELVFESDNFIIFYGKFGLFGYDLENSKITFTVDFLKAFGRMGSVQGSYGTSVDASADGEEIVFFDVDPDHPNDAEAAFFINVPTLTYTRGEYKPIENVFLRESAVGYVRPGGKIETTLYIRGDKRWALFDGYAPSH